ncbi:MAG: hypothetical protein KGI26_04825 [Thaumarchaeota archaeon]|nr:hypothetical protein [Nitrososphaerota archaeon]
MGAWRRPRMGFITYFGRVKKGTTKGTAWHRRSYDDGLEHITFIVRYRVRKATVNRKSFWQYLPPSLNSPPPRDEGHLQSFLVAHLERRGVELPQVVRIQRNQARGEKAGFHSVGMFALSETTIRVLRSYPGVRGVPHAPPEQDFWFKLGRVADFAPAVRRLPANPAGFAKNGRETEGPQAAILASQPAYGIGYSAPVETRPV